MRMMKMVIEFVVGKMSINKMGIGFQSRGMVAPFMLVSVHVFMMTVGYFGVIVNEREQK